MATTGELLGTGDVAARIGYSMSGVKKLDRLGVIPPSLKVAGRRAWRREDLPEIEARVAARRAERRTVTDTAA